MLFSNPLRAALVALATTASAVPAAAATSLKVTITGPVAVNGVEDLNVVTTLTNTGDETVKLLNHPSSILDTLPANTFTIANEHGASPDFIGAKFKYSPTNAATSNDPSAVTVMDPGTSLSFTHDLSAAYNFTGTGYGTYTVKPSNLLHAVGSNNEVSEIRADVERLTAKITGGKLAVARLDPSITNSATFTRCSDEQQAALNASITGAKHYADAALAYLRDNVPAATARYTAWFGGYTSARHDTVLDHFSRISANSLGDFKYDCSACTRSTAYAFVLPDDFGRIYLCGAFWGAPQTGADSQAGTLVHEASHFTANGGTEDYGYGPASAKALAKSDPDRAVFNADSHEYFAENDPAESAVPTPAEQMHLVLLQDVVAGPVQY